MTDAIEDAATAGELAVRLIRATHPELSERRLEQLRRRAIERVLAAARQERP